MDRALDTDDGVHDRESQALKLGWGIRWAAYRAKDMHCPMARIGNIKHQTHILNPPLCDLSSFLSFNDVETKFLLYYTIAGHSTPGLKQPMMIMREIEPQPRKDTIRSPKPDDQILHQNTDFDSEKRGMAYNSFPMHKLNGEQTAILILLPQEEQLGYLNLQRGSQQFPQIGLNTPYLQVSKKLVTEYLCT